MEDKIWVKTMKNVKKGFVAGPFDVNPYPNTMCDKEAIVALMFSIPKDKWNPESDDVRVLFHKSFPFGESINDYTPRADSGHEYYSVAKWLAKIARAGRGCTHGYFDVIGAYKLLNYAPEDWWQQVCKVRSKFFVNMTGVFGTVTAGDNWNCLIVFVLLCVKQVLGIPGVDAFVDNVDQVLPPLSPGVPDWKRANAQFDILRDVFTKLGFPLHEVVRPTTHVDKQLGWEVDTMEMWVGVPAIKMVRIKALVASWQDRKACTIKELSSMTGQFQYLSGVLRQLNSTVGVFIQKKSEWSRSAHKGVFTIPSRIKDALRWLWYLLQSWSGRSPIIDHFSLTYDCRIIADAGYNNTEVGPCFGRGAVCAVSRLYYSAEWSAEEVKGGHPEGSPFFELANYVSAAITWALRGFKHIHLTGDCEPAIKALWKRYSPSPSMLSVIRHLDFVSLRLACTFTFDVKPRDFVCVADSLARDCMQGMEAYSRIIPFPVRRLDLSKPPQDYWRRWEEDRMVQQ